MNQVKGGGARESDTESDTESSLIRSCISMIAMQLILQMGIPTPRQVSRHVQLKINATVASNLPPQMGLRHMRNNMLDRHGHVLSVIKSPKAMTYAQFTSTTGPSMKGGTCTSALLTHAQLMVTHLGIMSSTWSGGICRRTMACTPTWVSKCDGTFCSKQSQQKHIPTCLGKKDKFGPKQTPYAEKKFRYNECPKKYTTGAALMQHKKVHKGTAKKNVCSLCGKDLSSTTALHRHEKIHEDN